MRAKIDLHNAAAIRRELCAVYRQAKAGSIEIGDATKLTYILDAIRKAHDAEVLAERIERVELTLKMRTLKNG